MAPPIRSIFSPPSALTSPSTATRIGTSSCFIAAIRRCQSGASCLTCTARTAPFGLTPTHSVPPCRSSIIFRIVRKDYRALDRVYLPLDAMRSCGASVEELDAPKSSPALFACLKSIAERTAGLLPEASKLPLAVKDTRLGLETGAIVNLARRLTALLMTRDPLSERVHFSKPAAFANGLQGAAATLAARLTRRSVSVHSGQR